MSLQEEKKRNIYFLFFFLVCLGDLFENINFFWDWNAIKYFGKATSEDDEKEKEIKKVRKEERKKVCGGELVQGMI